MLCPKCNAPIREGQTVCENCGEPLPEVPDYDDEIVFSNNYDMVYRHIPWRLILPIAAAVLLIIAAIIIYFVINQAGKSTTQPYIPGTLTEATTMPATVKRPKTTVAETTEPTTAPPTTVAPTTIPPVTIAPVTAPPVTTPPTTTDPRTDNEKVQEYAQKSGMIDAIKSTADENMTVTVTVEQCIVVASYKVNADYTDEGYKDYFDQLTTYYDTLCTNLDRAIYEMRTNTGVSNATLHVVAVDRNGVQFYSRIVD